MKIESTELEEYIKSTINSILRGIDGTRCSIIKPIEFNLAVTNTTEAGGGMKIYVAKAEGKLRSEEISHMRFEIDPPIVKRMATIFNPHDRRKSFE